MSLTQDDVLKIVQIIKNSNFAEMKLEIGELKVEVNKKNEELHQFSNLPFEKEEINKEEEISPELQSEQNQSNEVSYEAKDEENLIPVKSPTHGIFYRSPSPGSQPFVEEGTFVEANDDLGIVEVMKLFNTIKSETSGRIVKICAENEEQIEMGQTLFLLEAM